MVAPEIRDGDEPLQRVKPRVTPVPSPPPIASHVRQSHDLVSYPLSKPSALSNRSKLRPSQADAVLVRSLSGPSHDEEIARRAGETVLAHSPEGSDAEVDLEEAAPMPLEMHDAHKSVTDSSARNKELASCALLELCAPREGRVIPPSEPQVSLSPELRSNPSLNTVVSPSSRLAPFQQPASSAASPPSDKVNLPGIKDILNANAPPTAPNGIAPQPLKGLSAPYGFPDLGRDRPSPHNTNSSTAYARPSPPVQDPYYNVGSVTSPVVHAGISPRTNRYQHVRRPSRNSEAGTMTEESPMTNGTGMSSGYMSTAESTPSDQQRYEGESPYLQQLGGDPLLQTGRRSSFPGNFKCDHKDCTAPAFATQYLLK
ncbi:MAG: hypothetical protein M1814_004832 [Vezdaea aestivalis]|nr:MAG: hypothetical protein M1814_004832 [Vezdaea aestivalis]